MSKSLRSTSSVSMVAPPPTAIDEQPSAITRKPSVRRNLWLLLISVVYTVVLLGGIYLFPLGVTQDIGSQPIAARGLYAAESNDRFSYAYTNGNASFRFPGAGVGSYRIELRIGGPGGAEVAASYVAAPSASVDLGRVGPTRTYRLLLDTDSGGAAEFDLLSATSSSRGDPRPLGLLVDRLHLRPVGPVAPPASLLFGAACLMVLVWLAIDRLRTVDHFRLPLLLLAGTAISVTSAIIRTRAALPIWLPVAIGAAVTAAGAFARYEHWPFALPLRKVAALFVTWRLVVWAIGALGLWFSESVYDIAHGRTYGGAISDHAPGVSEILVNAWVHYDSGHYQRIVTEGYQFTDARWPTVAFFPLFPILIRLLLPITQGSFPIAALLVSHVALFVALLVLFDLVKHDFGSSIAHRSLVYFLLFPTSVYLVAAYTESLALALAISALWSIRRQRWWLAGIIGFFLALTRLPGVMLAPVLAVAYLQQRQWRWREVRPAFLSALLPPLGLGVYMLFQWWRFGTPFAFLLAQQAWGGGSGLPWETAYNYFRAIFTSPLWPTLAFQVGCWAVFVILSALALKRLPLPYSLMMVLLLIPPVISNQYGSLPRYVLMGFPGFVVMALLTQRLWVRQIVVGLSFALFTLAIMIFVNGFWLA